MGRQGSRQFVQRPSEPRPHVVGGVSDERGEPRLDALTLGLELFVLGHHLVEDRQFTGVAGELRTDERPKRLVFDPVVMVQLVRYERPACLERPGARDADTALADRGAQPVDIASEGVMDEIDDGEAAPRWPGVHGCVFLADQGVLLRCARWY